MSAPRIDRRAGVAFLTLWMRADIAGVLLTALGAWPTIRISGLSGLLPMGIGIGVALFGSVAGNLLGAWALIRPPRQQLSMLLGSLMARFAVTLVLAVVLALTGPFAPRPLVLWAAIAQLALLAVDTIGLTRMLKQGGGPK
jgi:hypothetical protein